jgi:gliding motility-associated-like protein
MVLKNVNSRFYFLFFILFFCIHGYAHNPTGNGSTFRFIENKGQWEKQVEYKADLGYGAVFIEKDGFTFSLIDTKVLHDMHTGKMPDDNIGAPKTESLSPKIKGHAYKLYFKNSNPKVDISGINLLPEYFNFYKGNDPSKWASKVNAFTQIKYTNLYQGIDLLVYSHGGNFKYDFIVHPGADPKQIQFAYDGISLIKLRNENLELFTNIGKILESSPVAFYENQDSTLLSCSYEIRKDEYGFAFPEGYDANKTVIIDPELIFSTFSGSKSDNFGYTATYDMDGFLYDGSTVFGNGYPTTLGAFDRTFNGYSNDIAISKYDTTGTFMIYSTLLGGNGDELPHSMVCNAQGELYVFGTTDSQNFPVTPDSYDPTFNNQFNYDDSTKSRVLGGIGISYPYGCDIFVVKFNKDGSDLLSGTYLGGSKNDGLNSSNYTRITPGGYYWESFSADTLRYNYADEIRGEIDIDQNNNIYIATCTNSPDFPIVGNSYQKEYAGGRLDGVIVKMDGDLKNIIWSSYLGGSSADAIYSLTLDSKGGVYVTGGTVSPDFPVTSGVVAENYMGGRSDGFISYLDVDGHNLISSTFWGTPEYDQSYFIETDFLDYVYIYGQTEGKGSSMIHNANYSIPNSGQFVTKLSPLLDTLMWSTVFGTGSGAPNISPTAFLVDICRKIYLAGWGGGANSFSILDNNAGYTFGLPTTADAFQTTTDGSDFYIMVMEDDASALNYATFMGGDKSQEHVDGGTSRFDEKGKMYQSVCGGCGGNSDFPIKPVDAVSPINGSTNCNSAVFKFNLELPAVIADFEVPDIGCAPFHLQIKNRSLEQSNTKYFWDFGDGTTSTEKTPSHVYNKAGRYIIKLKLQDVATCNLADSTEREILILSDTSYSLPAVNICPGQSPQIGILPKNVDNISYSWVPATWLSNPYASNPFSTPEASINYTLLVSNGVCTDTITQSVILNPVDITAGGDRKVCSSDNNIVLQVSSSGSPTKFYWSSFPDFSNQINTDISKPELAINPIGKENYYYVKAENQYGCIAYDSVQVTVSDLYISVSDPGYICRGNSVEIFAQSDLPGDMLTYDWEPKQYILSKNDSSHIVVSPYRSQYFYVKATNELGCVYYDSILVEISPVAEYFDQIWADQDTIYEGLTTGLHVRPILPFDYLWSPESSLNNPTIPDPIAKPKVTTEYFVELTDQRAGCRVDTSIKVHVIPVICEEPNIFVPNAFTPNNDGNNDILYVRGAFVEEMHFIIYDRWGEKVFETFNQTNGWDGTYKGRKADPAVFVYYLEIRCIGGKTFFKKGNITVLK